MTYSDTVASAGQGQHDVYKCLCHNLNHDRYQHIYPLLGIQVLTSALSLCSQKQHLSYAAQTLAALGNADVLCCLSRERPAYFLEVNLKKSRHRSSFAACVTNLWSLPCCLAFICKSWQVLHNIRYIPASTASSQHCH